MSAILPSRTPTSAWYRQSRAIDDASTADEQISSPSLLAFLGGVPARARSQDEAADRRNGGHRAGHPADPRRSLTDPL